MKNLRIEITLATPLALGRTHLTLDAVLFGILLELEEHGQFHGDPIASIPLKCEDGLFFATAAEFGQMVETSELKIGGIRPVKDMANAAEFLQPKGRKLAKIVTTSGHTKAHLSRMRSIACATVAWDAVGDAERIEALLRRASSIGALRKDGHGQIASVDIEEADTDDEHEVLIHNGHPRRPIPVSSRHRLNVPTVIETWRPAYWDQANAAECYGLTGGTAA